MIASTDSPCDCSRLFASCGVNHLGEALDVFDQERVSFPLD